MHRATAVRLLPAAAARRQRRRGLLPPPRLPQLGRRRLDGYPLRGRREARAEEGARAGAVGAVRSCAEEMSHCVHA